MQALLNRSTLMDVLILHKDNIKELRTKGYDDMTICNLFMESYSFQVVTSDDLNAALARRPKKAS